MRTLCTKLCVLQIADSGDDLRKFDSSRTNPGSLAPVDLRMPVPQKVKVFLPNMRGKSAYCKTDFSTQLWN